MDAVTYMPNTSDTSDTSEISDPAGSPAILTGEDLSEAVRSTAMLANVYISVWGAARTDHAIMDKAKSDAGATGNVGRAVKNLLAGADGSYRDCKGAYAAVRNHHYAITLPWVADADRMRGPRLLPNMLFDKYMAEMSRLKRVALAALDKFIAEYPDAVNQARINLGALADANYPTPDEVRGAFKVSFDFEPIAAGSLFKGLPDAMLDKLARGLASKQARMAASASAAMWEQVRERVNHMVDRLSDNEATFRNSTIENVRELLALIPGWNVALDPRAAEIVGDIERMLSGVDAPNLRKSDELRAEIADRARSVAEKLNAWGL